MKLVIVESPTKAKTLSRFLGRGYQIMASMGHVRDLPKSKLSVDVDNNFEPVYEVVKGKQKVVKELRQEAKKAGEVILATDPDREGEAIAFHVQHLLDLKLNTKNLKHKFSRIVFHEITKEAVERALKQPGEVKLNLVNAQQARRVLDRLVGYKLSPLLWRKVRRGLSAGRVQSVAVKLVVEREREIEAFKPEEYWEIKVMLAKDKDKLLVKLVKVEGKRAEINDQAEADRIVSELKQASYAVKAVETRVIKRSAAPPFITSTLQRMAARRFGWSAKKTMSVAQKLYELGLITYHRTDSVSLAKTAVVKVRGFIASQYGQEYLPAKAVFYKGRSKMVQGAHEAVRPTKVDQTEVDLGRGMNQLYRMIWERFVACQMKAAEFDKTVIRVLAKAGQGQEYELMVDGERLRFVGWMKVSSKFQVPGSKQELPELKVNHPLQLIKVLPEQKFTQPPARYTEASLIKMLEDKGIGRPSTYAPILSTIQARQYVEKIEQSLKPTPVGVSVTEFLSKYFVKVMDYDFTAKIEADLDLIAEGAKQWQAVVGEFYKPFSQRLDKVAETAKRVKIKTEKTGDKCPKCKQGEVVIRVGRFGKFLSCGRFPDCDYKANYREVVEGVKCGECGAEVVIKKTRKGKRFFGCGNYPKCKWASWTKPKQT